MEKKAPCADEGVVHSGGRKKTSGQETVERMSLLSDAGSTLMLRYDTETFFWPLLYVRLFLSPSYNSLVFNC